MESRLGGVYALGRIARDSERDHMPIMSILAASLREESALLPVEPSEASPYTQAGLEVILGRNAGNETSASRYIDLRKLIAPKVFLYSEQFFRVNLSGASLVGADLRSCTFQDIYAVNVDFSSARLTSARFRRNVNFQNANFSNADLSKLTAQSAYMAGSSLRGTILDGASIQNSNLEGADFTGAVLKGADLSGTYFKGADLQNVDLRNARLRSANFVEAKLAGAQLLESQLTEVFLSEKGRAEVVVTRP